MGTITRIPVEMNKPKAVSMDEFRKYKNIHDVYARAYPFAGLSFFKRSKDENRICIILASRSYPWQICWSWMVDMTIQLPKLSRYNWRSYIFRDADNRIYQVGVRLGFICFYWHRQRNEYMLKKEYYTGDWRVK